VEGANYLKSGGWLLLEMDPEQTTKALKLIDKTNKYQKKDRIKDYSHQYRVVMAQKK
jgi:methylase of polypeptide subunit release factors